MIVKRLATLALCFIFVGALGSVVRAANIDTKGNVFLGAQNGNVYEFTPSGTLVQTLGTGQTQFVTGMAFDSAGNLYTTDIGVGNVSQISGSTGALITGTYITGMSSPESIAVDSSGNMYITQVGGGGIKEFSPTGTFIKTLNAGQAATRSDWNDLAADQTTLLYSTESSTIFSTNAATNTANANLVTNGGNIAAFRIIPTGPDAGDILASQENGNAALIDPVTGMILKTYSLPSGSFSFALNLDPNGTDFWTADIFSGRVWEVNIATGAIDENWLGGVGEIGGLIVFGQITASGGGGGGTTPEPGSLSLLACGLVGLLGASKFLTR
jgi:streptogramin lyase